MIVEVLYQHPDGSIDEERFKAPRITVQAVAGAPMSGSATSGGG